MESGSVTNLFIFHFVSFPSTDTDRHKKFTPLATSQIVTVELVVCRSGSFIQQAMHSFEIQISDVSVFHLLQEQPQMQFIDDLFQIIR